MIIGPLRTGASAPREHIVERALRQHVGTNYSHNNPLEAWHSLLSELETFRTMEHGRKIARQASQTPRKQEAVS